LANSKTIVEFDRCMDACNALQCKFCYDSVKNLKANNDARFLLLVKLKVKILNSG